MATVRHRLCRIDFDPADITGNSIISVTDNDGVIIETTEVRTTHLISAVTKLMMVQTRRHTALAKMIGEMDDEINDAKTMSTPTQATDTNSVDHARVCTIVGPHDSSGCVLVMRVADTDALKS